MSDTRRISESHARGPRPPHPTRVLTRSEPSGTTHRGETTSVDGLDFLYTPSRDVAADMADFVDVLGGRLVFAIEDGGIRVAMVELTDGPPRILLTDHVEGDRPILVYRVDRPRPRRRGAQGARLDAGTLARDPAWSVQLVPLAGRPPDRALPADPARRSSAISRAAATSDRGHASASAGVVRARRSATDAGPSSRAASSAAPGHPAERRQQRHLEPGDGRRSARRRCSRARAPSRCAADSSENALPAIGVAAAPRQLDEERRDHEAPRRSRQGAGHDQERRASVAAPAGRSPRSSRAARPAIGTIGRIRSTSQPVGNRAMRMTIPSATKNSPMFAPAASARCGRNATTTPQWVMNNRSIAMSDAQVRRNANPSRRCATPVGPSDAEVVRAVRQERQRRDPQDDEAGDDEGRRHQRDAVERRRGEDGERQGRDDRPASGCGRCRRTRARTRAATGSTSLGTSDRAAGSVAAMPIPWKTLATRNGPVGPPGSTPGSSRTAQPRR